MAQTTYSIAPIYDDILDAADGYAIVVQNKRVGVVDHQNEVVIPFEYDPAPEQYGRQCNETASGIAVLKKGPGQLVMFHLPSKRQVNDEPFQEAHFKQYDHYRGVILVKQNDKYGLINYEGHWVLPPKFDRLWPCDNGRMGDYGGQIPGNQAYYTGLIDNKAGLYNTQGEMVLPHEFIHLAIIEVDGISCIAAKKQVSDELMEIMGDFYNPQTGRQETQIQWIPTEKWGLIDFQGNTIAPYCYDNILYAGKGRFLVLDNAMQFVWYGDKRSESFIRNHEASEKIRFGVLNSEGKEIVPPTLLQTAFKFNEDGFIPFRTEAGWGVMDIEGKTIIPPDDQKYQITFLGGLFFNMATESVGQNVKGKYGFRNSAMEWAIPAIYDELIAGFYQGRAVLKKRKDIVVIDSDGKELLTFENCDAENIQRLPLLLIKRMHPEKKKKFVGIFNFQTGEFIIPDVYKNIDTSTAIEDGIFIVTDENNQKGYIDVSGKVISPCQYNEVNPFSEGLALVKANGLYGFIDRDGREVIAPAFKSATPWEGNATIVTVGKKKGVVFGY